MTLRRLVPASVSAVANTARRLPFAPTGRAALLFGIGLVWLVPAWIDPRAALLTVLWNVLVVLALIADGLRLPRPEALRLTRVWSDALTIGRPASVSLELHNSSETPVAARLTDHLSAALHRELPILRLLVGRNTARSASYAVTPQERGDADAGTVVVEWRSSWGLVERWAEARLAQSVRVYPDIHEGRRHAMFLIRSQQVALEKRRTRRAVGGREFDRLREYRPGDDRRDVNWRVSARRGRLVTRLSRPERSQTIWLLVDAGRLLRARSGDQTLLDRAATAALTIAQVAMRSGDNVGLVGYGRRIQHRLLPGRGPFHLRRLTEALALLRGEPVEADHGAAAAALRTGQQRRALIVWLTEIAETAGVPDVIEYATHLVPRHVLLFATMRQPEIAALSAMRPATPRDMYRVVAAQEAVTRRDALLRGLRRRGAVVMEATPEELSRGLVDRYLELKDRGRV